MTSNSASLCLLIKRKLKWDTKRCAKIECFECFRSFEKYKWNNFITAPLKSSCVPCPSEEGEAESSPQVLQKEPASQGSLGLSHCASLCAGGGCRHPSISHEWSNPFCRSTSWPKGGGSARFPVCLVLTSWPWACLGACRAKLKAGGSAGELAGSWTRSWQPYSAQEAV